MNPLDSRYEESRLPADAEPGDPSPAEISQACERIQATWSEEEREYRAALGQRFHIEESPANSDFG
jgi:hypothetical protein